MFFYPGCFGRLRRRRRSHLRRPSLTAPFTSSPSEEASRLADGGGEAFPAVFLFFRLVVSSSSTVLSNLVVAP